MKKQADQVFTGDLIELGPRQYVVVGVQFDTDRSVASLFTIPRDDYDGNKVTTTYGLVVPRKLLIDVVGKRGHTIQRIDFDTKDWNNHPELD